MEGGDRSPQVSHKSQLCGQGAGGGQGPGAASAAYAGLDREARVRCSCKSSPKCFQAKANQGTVTDHTRPHLAPVGTLMSVQAYTHSQLQNHACLWSAYRAVQAKVSHPHLDTR